MIDSSLRAVNNNHSHHKHFLPHNPHSQVHLQFGCNGIRDKLHEILRFMEQNNIVIAALKETKLTIISTPNHRLVTMDRKRNKGLDKDNSNTRIGHNELCRRNQKHQNIKKPWNQTRYLH